MNNTTYNGWTNYATWRVNLEIFDGLDPKEHFLGYEDSYSLSHCLKDYAEEIIGIHSTSNALAMSYAAAFIEYVNWEEIAEHMIEEYSEA